MANRRRIPPSRRVSEFGPNLLEAHLWLSKAYWTKGLYPEAISEAEKAASYSGRTPRYVAGVGYALAAASKRADAIISSTNLFESHRALPLQRIRRNLQHARTAR